MKIIRASFLLLALTTLLTRSPATAAIVIPGLYNTGVNDAGVAQPLHSPELHYTVTGPSDESYVVPVVFHTPGNQAWLTAPAGSAWIGPNSTDSTWPLDPTGIYSYKLSFSLTGVDLSKLEISGLWASDDDSQIWMNNQYSGFSKSGWATFTQLTPFHLQGLFVEGMNVLEFRVSNSAAAQYPNGNPSGVLVAGLTAADDGSLVIPPDITPVIPEPSTYLAGALLLLPFCGGVLRKLRKA